MKKSKRPAENVDNVAGETDLKSNMFGVMENLSYRYAPQLNMTQ